VLASPRPPCKESRAIDARTEEALIGGEGAAAVVSTFLVAAASRGKATSPIVAETPARMLTGTFANQNGVVSL